MTCVCVCCALLVALDHENLQLSERVEMFWAYLSALLDCLRRTEDFLKQQQVRHYAGVI